MTEQEFFSIVKIISKCPDDLNLRTIQLLNEFRKLGLSVDQGYDFCFQYYMELANTKERKPSEFNYSVIIENTYFALYDERFAKVIFKISLVFFKKLGDLLKVKETIFLKHVTVFSHRVHEAFLSEIRHEKDHIKLIENRISTINFLLYNITGSQKISVKNKLDVQISIPELFHSHHIFDTISESTELYIFSKEEILEFRAICKDIPAAREKYLSSLDILKPLNSLAKFSPLLYAESFIEHIKYLKVHKQDILNHKTREEARVKEFIHFIENTPNIYCDELFKYFFDIDISIVVYEMYLAKVRKQDINVINSLSEAIKKNIRKKENNDHEKISKVIQSMIECDRSIPLYQFYERKLASSQVKTTLSENFDRDVKIAIINKHRDNILSLDQSDWVNCYVFREMYSDSYFRCYKLYDDLQSIIREFYINSVCPYELFKYENISLNNLELSHVLPNKLNDLLLFLESRKKIMYQIENKQYIEHCKHQIKRMISGKRKLHPVTFVKNEEMGVPEVIYLTERLNKEIRGEISKIRTNEENRKKPDPIFDVLISDIIERFQNYSDKVIYNYAETMRMKTFKKKHIVEQVAHKFFSHITVFYQSFNATDTHSETIKQDNTKPSPDAIASKEKGQSGRKKKKLNGPLDIFINDKNLESCLAILEHDFHSKKKSIHNILKKDGSFNENANKSAIVLWVELLEENNLIEIFPKNEEYINVLSSIIPNFKCSKWTFSKKSYKDSEEYYKKHFDKEISNIPVPVIPSKE